MSIRHTMARSSFVRFARAVPALRPNLPPTLACLAVLLLISSTSFAQSGGIAVPGASSAPLPAEKFALTGTVVDSATGEPIRRALVQVYGRQRRTTFSDGDGHFELEDIPADTYTVTAQKPGYFNQQELLRGAVPPVEVGPKTASAVVKLVPEAVIAGRVANSAGVPIEHVSVNLEYVEVREGRRHWESKGSAITDEDGRYRFSSLKPGTYYLNASPYTPLAETMLDANTPPKTGFSGVYYAGATDLASASPIQLTAGQQVEANFVLTEAPVYAVSGTVSGYGPNQGVGIQVFDQSGLQTDRGAIFNSENGRFDIHALAAGNYVIKAFSSLGPNQSVRAELQFPLAADLHNLHLLLAPTPSIPVVVRIEGQAVRQQANSNTFRASGGAREPGPPVSIRLGSTAPGVGEVYASSDDPQNPRNLSLHNLEPGRYTAVLDAREGWYVASAEFGQTNLLTDDLLLTSGAPPSPLIIVLRHDSASLAGSVHVPDDFASQVTIVAVPEAASKAAPGITYWYPPRHKNGPPPEFMLDSLAPGSYLIFAFEHAEGLEYSNRDVLESYVSQAAHVTLSPGQRAKVTLELIRIPEAAD
jgi:Carboxypeptidase regulatory-like domain